MVYARIIIILSLLLTALAGCGSSSGTAAPASSAELKLGTSGTSTTLGAVDITFPVFAQYSVTSVQPTATSLGTVVWDKIAGPTPKIRVQLAVSGGFPPGTDYATVLFAIRNGAHPQATEFNTVAQFLVKDINGGTITGLAPTFTIVNVR